MKIGCRHFSARLAITAVVPALTARVELIPGSGQVLKFRIGSDGRAEAVDLDEETFRRE